MENVLVLLRFLFPPFLLFIGYAEQMTHHHSWPSPISLSLWNRLLVRRVCCIRSGGWSFILGVLRFRKGQNGPGPGSGFLPPFSLHCTLVGILLFLWLNLLNWSPCHHFLLSMSCTITDTPTHHTDLERRRGSVEVKATAALLIPNPAQ